MKYLPILLSVLIFAACKKPQASFVHDYVVVQGGTDEYLKAGTSVHFINTSKDANHYVWHLPNGTTANTKDLTFVVDTFAQYNAPLTIGLTAYNKSGEKSSEASLTYKAQPFAAPLIFWMQTGSPYNQVKVDIEGFTIVIDTVYASQPTEPYRRCVVGGKKGVGDHYYDLYDNITGNHFGSGIFTINPRIINFIKVQ